MPVLRAYGAKHVFSLRSLVPEVINDVQPLVCGRSGVKDTQLVGTKGTAYKLVNACGLRERVIASVELRALQPGLAVGVVRNGGLRNVCSATLVGNSLEKVSFAGVAPRGMAVSIGVIKKPAIRGVEGSLVAIALRAFLTALRSIGVSALFIKGVRFVQVSGQEIIGLDW